MRQNLKYLVELCAKKKNRRKLKITETIVEEEFGKENQNGRIIIFDIKYEFHSEVSHNQG